MDYRKLHGEEITGESWLMRDLWQTTDANYGAKFGLATYPKRLKSSGIKSLIERAIRAQGLSKPLPQGVCRREWKGVHGMRKFYKTHAEQVMKPINVEITMGHDIGVSASYYEPTERAVLEDYMMAVDLLTINGHSKLLLKQITDKEVMNLKEQIAAMQEAHKEILDLLRDPIKLAEAVKAH
jgi:hypothetical protein